MSVAPLPQSLSRWRNSLSLFPPELALGLGPLVHRLALALGPLRAQRSVKADEPDGVDGLARRGSYERLLPTEWLLADEVPDEFLRRAAQGEHAFLRLARCGPVGGRRSVLLLDAGPEQLGGPRIAQMALLIVQAARAEAARVPFAWGVIQDTDLTLVASVTPTSVLRLLRARTAKAPSPARLEAWMASLDAPSAPDDLWLAGGARLRAMIKPRGASRLWIDDVVEPDARRVHVEVDRMGQGTRSIDLDLPPPDACARLLRDPFSATTPPLRTSPRSPDTSGAPVLLFAAHGRRLIVRLAGGGAMAIPIPTSAREAPGKPVIFDPAAGEKVVAAGWHYRRFLVVTMRDGSLSTIHQRGRRGGSISVARTAMNPTDYPVPDRSAGLGTCLLQTGSGGPERLYFTAGRDLLSVSDADVVLPIAREVRCVAMARGRVCYVTTASVTGDGIPNPRVEVIDPSGRSAPVPILAAYPYAPGDAYFGYAHVPLHPEVPVGLLAFHDRPGRWKVLRAGGSPELHPFSGTTVAGIVGGSVEGNTAGLVVVEADGRTVSLIGQRQARSLTVARDRIVAIAASHVAPQFALLTEAGDLEVHSLIHGLVLRLDRGAAP